MFNAFKIVFLFLLLSFKVSASTKAAEDFFAQLISFSKLSQELSGKQSELSKKKLKEIQAQIDFPRFSGLALGSQKSKVSASETKRFQALLEELIKLAAFPKARYVSAESEAITYKLLARGKVQVVGKVQREKAGDLIVNDFSIVLHMDPRNRIYDVEFEKELLSANISRQIKKNLEKKTFAQLLSLMEKRVSKLRAPKESAKKSS